MTEMKYKAWTSRYGPGDMVYVDDDRRNKYAVTAVIIRKNEDGESYVGQYELSWLHDGDKVARVEGYRLAAVPEHEL